MRRKSAVGKCLLTTAFAPPSFDVTGGTRPGTQIVIDEIQKVPALLDEVHWLIENRGLHFALCGSSARKVRRGGANLLGEGPFAASFTDCPRSSWLTSSTWTACSRMARNATFARDATKSFFGILEDTLIGRWLPAYRRRPKRRVIGAPKFYFGDVGIVNRLARRGEVLAGSEQYGKAFENWVFHELTSFASYRELDGDLAHWRLASGIEVDFVLGNMELAVEAKSSTVVTSDHLKGLRALAEDHPDVGRRVVVCREPKPRVTSDGVEILPAATFVQKLWDGDLRPLPL